MPLRFALSGIPRSLKKADTPTGIAHVRALGLDGMEMAWVHQVPKNVEKAALSKAASAEHGVALTVHAPYYINLNAKEPEKLVASRERILACARMARTAGATHIAIHSGFYMGDDPAAVTTRVRAILLELEEELAAEGNGVFLCPELMGRTTQLGTVEEVIALSQGSARIRPCVDFSHLHARTQGAWGGYDDFMALFDALEAGLGKDILDDLHMQVAGIEYGKSGEKKHLAFRDPASTFPWEELVRALKDRGVGGQLVAESPAGEEDAMLLQKTYFSLR